MGVTFVTGTPIQAFNQSISVHFLYGGNISDYSINYSMEKGRVSVSEAIHLNESTYA